MPIVSPRILALMLVVLLGGSVAGCATSVGNGAFPPDPTPRGGEALPSSGPPEIGVPYAIVAYCPADVAIGGTFWRFSDASHWPPEIPVTINGVTHASNPYAVPGTVTLTSSTTAIFRADVDGSKLQMTKVESNPILDGCI